MDHAPQHSFSKAPAAMPGPMGRRVWGAVVLGMVLLNPCRADELPAYRPDPALSGTFICSGGDTMWGVTEAWRRLLNQYQPETTLKIRRDTKLSADGFTQFMAGKVDCVTFVREPFASELAAYQEKFGTPPLLVAVAGGSFATKGGTHAMAIYVNQSNPLTQLSLSQLDAILSAERRRGAPAAITKWGQLGLTGEWANRPVHVYGMLHARGTGNPPGIVNFIQQRVDLGSPFRKDIAEQEDADGESALEAIVRQVAKDPDGIGYSGFGYAKPGVHALALGETDDGPFVEGTDATVAQRAYPLSRQIYLMVGQPLSPLNKSLLLLALSREGQKAIADDPEKFIPLSPEQADAARASFTSSRH